ncbi:UNVERIFIED_CONTAM: hypothetical protein PYX00_002349 [Menopon gallinae]|uniref:MIP18 family-like domain-containing protein n=1 Tax=Menopon gallinae TaxID=328185 RepID=A0AAW2IHQ5_9NEOP
MPRSFENVNPVVYGKSDNRLITSSDEDEDVHDEIDRREVFDLIRGIKDPEYPLTLEELNVVQQDLIYVSDEKSEVELQFTPTVPHCSMASLIGLSLKTQLLRALPSRFKISIIVTPGSHSSESSVNKQLNDKERVAAALENSNLTEVINQCIAKAV